MTWRAYLPRLWATLFSTLPTYWKEIQVKERAIIWASWYPWLFPNTMIMVTMVVNGLRFMSTYPRDSITGVNKPYNIPTWEKSPKSQGMKISTRQYNITFQERNKGLITKSTTVLIFRVHFPDLKFLGFGFSVKIENFTHFNSNVEIAHRITWSCLCGPLKIKFREKICATFFLPRFWGYYYLLFQYIYI